MKKITKAAIAGTVGAALLVGGAGSLAFWTDTENGPAVQIQSGQLDIAPLTSASQTWKIQQVVAGSTSSTSVDFAPATDKIVPGDVLTTTVNVPVTLVGKNIKAKLDVAVQALTPRSPAGTPANIAADAALIAALNSNGGIKVTKINNVAVTGLPTANLTAGGTIPVEIAVTFPWGDATTNSYNAAMLGLVNFQANYTLTQIPVTTP